MSRPEPRSVLRLALTPRWLVAAALMVLFVVAAVFLGRWQWERTQSILVAERAAISEAIPIEEVLGADANPPTAVPDEGIGRPVTLSGRYEPAMQVAVTNREHEGRPGVWIVTGLRLPDGRIAAVLRGWLETPEGAAAVAPTGPVAVSGILQPDETFYADAASTPGTVAAIDHARLADLWQEPLLPGFTVLEAQEPSLSPAPVPVLPTVQTADVPFPLQNFAYAFQWWIFALFAMVVYARWLYVDAQGVHYGEGS
ncbi:MAG: SURF1 family protein [Actinobacteria bacterium]|nr:SURF1 family protein [Actinomycetota bacterium]